MRKTFAVLAVLIAGCATRQQQAASPFSTNTQTSAETAGSCRNPFPITAFSEDAGSATEMAFIAGRYPGATRISRTESRCGGKAADRVKFRDSVGKKVVLYFDKSRWAR